MMYYMFATSGEEGTYSCMRKVDLHWVYSCKSISSTTTHYLWNILLLCIQKLYIGKFILFNTVLRVDC